MQRVKLCKPSGQSKKVVDFSKRYSTWYGGVFESVAYKGDYLSLRLRNSKTGKQEIICGTMMGANYK